MKITGQRIVKEPHPRGRHFNNGEHLFVTVELGQYQTISAELPNGRYVTFAFVPSSIAGEFECVDIHTTVGEAFHVPNRVGDQFWEQQVIGFSADTSGNSFDSRVVKREKKVRTTLATVRLTQP